MPLWTSWKRFTKEEISKLPNKRGAYQLAARNKIIVDIGGSDNETSGIKSRLVARFNSGKYPTAYFFRCRYVDFLSSGIELEGKTTKKHIEKNGKRPKYNKRAPRIDNDYGWF